MTSQGSSKLLALVASGCKLAKKSGARWLLGFAETVGLCGLGRSVLTLRSLRVLARKWWPRNYDP